MNNISLQKHLIAFRKWIKANNSQFKTEKKEREQLSIQVQSYTDERLNQITEDELFDYIAPLWAMAMWGNKHYQIDNIIEANGMPLLRAQLSNLIYGEASLAKRWDEFRSKIKGIGPAIMSELLCKSFPDKYLLWNRKTYNGFSALEVPNLPRYEARLNGKTYEYLCSKGSEILSYSKGEKYDEVDNMLTLNTFIWQELQDVIDNTPSAKIVEQELIPTNTKDAAFIHNDIRDKLAEIGRCLGFSADVEKKIAPGAVVDAIWEVTIGNMGRVIYVFEVQTSGSIDSLILNLIRAKNNKAVQGVVAVSDQKQIEKIQREISTLKGAEDIKFWNYTEVLKIHESLQYVNESINNLGLVPLGL